MKPGTRWSIIAATVAGLVVLFVLLRPDTPPEVTFRDGAVQGATRFTVTQGERVRILVRADVIDEVHLHSYDLSADVAPGDPARIDFVADVPGVFECELEGASELLFQLEIVP